METFIFRASEIGQRSRCALTAAARRGVRARLLVDTVGSFGSRRDYFDEFLAATARQQFEADLAQQAIRIMREALQHDRSWWQRLKQRFAYWLFARFDSELAALKLQVWHGCKERFMRRFRAARVRRRRDQSP